MAFLLNRTVTDAHTSIDHPISICNEGQAPLFKFSDAGDRTILVRGKNMKLNAQDLKEIVTVTLEHYNQRAEGFWAGTRDHDVSQNIAAMLRYIEGEPR